MFNFFKKNSGIYAPVQGKCQDIEMCHDDTFAQKLLGDGVVFETEDEIIKAPCDGRIISVFPTKHAIGMETKQGVQILLHIGIDTVKLNGKYFELYVKQGDKVKRGTALLRMEQQMIQKEGFETPVILVLLENEKEYTKFCLNQNVTTDDLIIQLG